MGYGQSMYRTTFRILETHDEHFCETALFNYHWSLHGLDLPDPVLKKVYREKAPPMIDLKCASIPSRNAVSFRSVHLYAEAES